MQVHDGHHEHERAAALMQQSEIERHVREKRRDAEADLDDDHSAKPERRQANAIIDRRPSGQPDLYERQRSDEVRHHPVIELRGGVAFEEAQISGLDPIVAWHELAVHRWPGIVDVAGSEARDECPKHNLHKHGSDDDGCHAFDER